MCFALGLIKPYKKVYVTQFYSQIPYEANVNIKSQEYPYFE